MVTVISFNHLQVIIMSENEITRPRGKPLGYRSNKTLHDQIFTILKEDKDQKGDGLTAFAISKALGTPDPTIRLYLADLVAWKKVSERKIANMTLYRVHKMASKD
jgi:hypothetical protein